MIAAQKTDADAITISIEYRFLLRRDRITSTVSLDESGNVGSQDRYFVMSALIVKRTSDLNKPFKLLDEIRKRKTKKKGSSFEVKFSHSYTDEKMEF